MRHFLVFATVLLALVALWVYQDRRELAARAAGVKRIDPTLLGCASLLIAGGVYAAVVVWSHNVLLALVAGLVTPVLLTFGSLILRSVLHELSPRWFPEPPAPPEKLPADGAATAQVPTLAQSAFGRPAPAFETVGTWMSARGNCRNTAWTPAAGARSPKPAWHWNVVAGEPEYQYSIAGAPAVDRNGTAFIATSHGLVALDADGKRLWSLGEDRAALPALDRSGRVACAFQNRLLVATPEGEASWFDVPGLNPVAVTVGDDGNLFVVAMGDGSLDSGRLMALTPGGAKRWSVSCLRGIDYPPAVSASGGAHLSSHDSIVWNPDDPSASYDRLQSLSAAGADVGHVDANDEGYSSVWGATAAMCLEDGTPIVGFGNGIRIGSVAFECKGWGTLAVDPQGTLYVGGRDLVAIDLSAGREKWRLALNGAAMPIVDGEGTIYVGLQNSIAAVAPAGNMLWSWEPPGEQARYGGWLRGLAIGPERTLYVATQRVLFALRG